MASGGQDHVRPTAIDGSYSGSLRSTVRVHARLREIRNRETYKRIDERRIEEDVVVGSQVVPCTGGSFFTALAFFRT
jgi:hypothetical protein